MQFQQFFKNSPKPRGKQHEKKCISREVKARSEKTEQIKKLESPIKGEMRPAYEIYFHAREQRGKPVMSYRAMCSPVQFGTLLAHWICDASTEIGYDANAMCKGISTAVAEAVKIYNEQQKQQKTK